MPSLNYYQDGASLDHTPASALSGGDPTQLPDGRVGVAINDIAANELGAVRVGGLFNATKASGTVFAAGDEVWWDASASLAVAKALTLDGSADFYLGTAYTAGASGETDVLIELNSSRPLKPIVYEFDCDGDNGDTDDHTLIPAEQNPNGLVVLGIYGLVTEVFAGSTEDQGVVTVEDNAATTLATLTASDTAADVVGDIIVGYSAPAATTGAAGVTVAAGNPVTGKVSQQTSGGTPAGKMKVYIHALPLV